MFRRQLLVQNYTPATKESARAPIRFSGARVHVVNKMANTVMLQQEIEKQLSLSSYYELLQESEFHR